MKISHTITSPALICFLLLTCCHLTFAKEWHVAGNGNDANNGNSPATAFRTLQKAADLVEPGDVVLIGNGKYTSTDRADNSSVLSITRSGRPDAWITWKARPGHKPEVHPRGWSGIQISGSYHILDGLTVIGANDSLTLIDALKEAENKTPNPLYNTNGIFFNGRNNAPDAKPHHLIIRNCTVAKCPGGGITIIEADYATIEDCNVYDNAWFMRYGGSGITTLNLWAFDDAPGYHIIIQRNLVWNNKTLVPWERIGKLSDGNGILLDVTDQAPGATNPNDDASIVKDNPAEAGQPAEAQKPAAPAKPRRPVWKGRALIANNISAYNGGSGIHTFRTRHVDIINNTTYWNGQVVGYQELFPNRSEDIVILNNIIVPKPGGKVTSDNRNTNIIWDYNLYPTVQQVFTGKNDIVADPGFRLVEADLCKSDFRLTKNSPAINSGTNQLAQPTDLKGTKRPKGKAIDRGALEQ